MAGFTSYQYGQVDSLQTDYAWWTMVNLAKWTQQMGGKSTNGSERAACRAAHNEDVDWAPSKISKGTDSTTK